MTDAFKAAEGMRYQRFMARMHEACLFDWYLEIGCRTGRIFGRARGKTIAVDPYFQVEENVIVSKPQLHAFQMTSDAFFKSGFLAAMNVRLGFSFLDGMHLFEYLLRDFIGTERASVSHGFVAVHDCCPFNHQMTTRDLDNLPDGAWTGDVWKIIPILNEYRPDLSLVMLDAAPTGLLVVSGLDPNSNVLADAYDEIVARYAEETLESYGLRRFNGLFDFSSAREVAQSGFGPFKAVTLPEDLALQPEKITP